MAEQAAEQKSEDKRITLGYWKIQGLACPARMMLMYAKEDFNNVMYDGAKAKEEWFEGAKPKLLDDLPFCNLPYLIDTKTNAKFTESRSIYRYCCYQFVLVRLELHLQRYIARQFKVGVQEDPDLALADEIQVKIHDKIRAPFMAQVYQGGDCSEKGMAEYLEKAIPNLAPFEAFMKDRKFICGDTISYADFSMYYLLSAHRKIKDSYLTDAKLTNLAAFIDNFEKLPFIEHWKKSDYAKLPLNNTMAGFR